MKHDGESLAPYCTVELLGDGRRKYAYHKTVHRTLFIIHHDFTVHYSLRCERYERYEF